MEYGQQLLRSIAPVVGFTVLLVACSPGPSPSTGALHVPADWVVSANGANNLRVVLPPDLNIGTDQWRVVGSHWTDGPVRVYVFVAAPGDQVGQPESGSQAAVVAWLEAQNGVYVTQQSRSLQLPAGEALEVMATYRDAADDAMTLSYAIATHDGFVWVQIDASREEWERRGESLRLIPYFVEVGPPG